WNTTPAVFRRRMSRPCCNASAFPSSASLRSEAACSLARHHGEMRAMICCRFLRSTPTQPLTAAGVLLVALFSLHADSGARPPVAPGARSVVDAHNCYPYNGRWGDRIERALSAGLPVAIEQDLAWYVDPQTGAGRSVLSHEKQATGAEPGMR